VITRHLEYIEELYKIAENGVDPSKVDSQKLDKIQSKYQKKMKKKKHGTEIKKKAYITREECFHYLYENTDFMPIGIENLIK
jgi:ABC-type Zn uptake system ZnuABC Zn-binding protein ZnuA